VGSFLFLFIVYFLIFILFLVFWTNNLLLFYIFFEISLIPTLILILGWGYQPERLQAGIYFMIYTMCASLPLLINILYIESFFGRLFMFFSFLGSNHIIDIVSLWWLVCIIAFMVKMPIYLTHL